MFMWVPFLSEAIEGFRTIMSFCKSSVFRNASFTLLTQETCIIASLFQHEVHNNKTCISYFSWPQLKCLVSIGVPVTRIVPADNLPPVGNLTNQLGTKKSDFNFRTSWHLSTTTWAWSARGTPSTPSSTTPLTSFRLKAFAMYLTANPFLNEAMKWCHEKSLTAGKSFNS